MSAKRKKLVPKIVLSGEEAAEIVYGDSEKFTAVQDEITDTSRWSVHHYLVFQQNDNGKLYETNYSRGATEYQEEHPFEGEREVTCVEVEEYQKTVTDYREVKD